MQLRFDSGIGTVTVDVPDETTLKRFFAIREDQIDEAVRTSATQFVSEVQKRAPFRSGKLRQGIVVSQTREKKAAVGRIVWDVWMDPGMNDIFQRPLPNGKHAYYPASMEYGFRLRNGKHANGRYFMRLSATDYYSEFTEKMTAVVQTTINGHQMTINGRKYTFVKHN